MKKEMVKYMVAALAMISFLSGCRNDSHEPQGAISPGAVFTRWGATQSEVMDFMNNGSMVYMDDGFICYNGTGNVKTVSYRLENDSLLESMVIMPEDATSLSDVQATFRNFEHLGERNNAEVYVNRASNTIVTISQETYGGASYYVVGYAALDMSRIQQ